MPLSEHPCCWRRPFAEHLTPSLASATTAAAPAPLSGGTTVSRAIRDVWERGVPAHFLFDDPTPEGAPKPDGFAFTSHRHRADRRVSRGRRPRAPRAASDAALGPGALDCAPLPRPRPAARGHRTDRL